MRQYSEAFRSRMLDRMTGARAVSASALSREVGVAQPVLSRSLLQARKVEGMTPSPKKNEKQWTGAEKLRVVMKASTLNETELGALLRREGIHETQLAEWRAAAEGALDNSSRVRSSRPSNEAKRIRELERELNRKEKALAETAALLVLKKKVQAIWGDEDDTTDPRRER